MELAAEHFLVSIRKSYLEVTILCAREESRGNNPVRFFALCRSEIPSKELKREIGSSRGTSSWKFKRSMLLSLWRRWYLSETFVMRYVDVRNTQCGAPVGIFLPVTGGEAYRRSLPYTFSANERKGEKDSILIAHWAMSIEFGWPSSAELSINFYTRCSKTTPMRVDPARRCFGKANGHTDERKDGQTQSGENPRTSFQLTQNSEKVKRNRSRGRTVYSSTIPPYHSRHSVFYCTQ